MSEEVLRLSRKFDLWECLGQDGRGWETAPKLDYPIHRAPYASALATDQWREKEGLLAFCY